MSSLNRSESTRTYWRSLRQLEDSAEFQELVSKEFPAGPEGEWSSTSRRRFLQLMGASVALGTASSCRWQQGYIAPMSERPEGWVPGTPRHYSTCMEIGGVAEALTVTSYDGRPTKVEGNASHPSSQGSTTSYAQAATLELYDPDRSRGYARYEAGSEVPASEEEFRQFLAANVRPKVSDGSGLAVIAEASSSPAMARLHERFAATFPNAQYVEFEPLSRFNEQAGCATLFGVPTRPVYQLEQADIIVALDDDLLGQHPDRLRVARGFASRRRPEDGAMSRLYAVEASFSVTGARADHRLPLRGEQVGAFLTALENELAGRGIGTASAAVDQGTFAEEHVQTFLHALAGDLAGHRGRSLISVGPGQPAAVHARAHALNLALGNRGRTVEYHDASTVALHDPADLRSLVQSLNSGGVDTLVVLGGNPVYNAPADLDFAAAMAKVEHRVHLGLYRDETAVASTWHVPATHWLESWADARSWDGTWTLRQPLIEPLWGGKSVAEMLGMVIGRGVIEGRNWTRSTFREEFSKDELVWRQAVQRGFMPGSGLAIAGAASGSAPALQHSAAVQAAWSGSGSVEAVFQTDHTLYDGRFANLGWLQELPDPLTKLTWDNAAVVSLATAEALGLADMDEVEVELDGRSVKMGVYVMPGQATGTVGIALGYGRSEGGHVAGLWVDQVDSVGSNTYSIFSAGAAAFRAGATLTATGGHWPLASTQDHHLVDEMGMQGRADRLGELVREGSLEKWKQEPDFAQHVVHHPPLKSLWDEHPYEGYRWGMSIDLSTCIGCSSCTIACQSENNIPVVGKEEVMNGREMAWIRMDRYFSGDAEDPKVLNQPVGCMHCELAPCEQVCPVAATTHTSEGLNDMVYNRCIGTRYCANNCPYKVRRFNYYNFNKQLDKPDRGVEKLGKNPEVTVRARGVMEKCTFCVQRIQTARVDAHNQGEQIQDGAITPACAQVCPTQAIHFGDLNDEQSAVRQKHDNDRAYAMLAELNNKPRTAYLAAIRNTHPDMTPAEATTTHGGGEEESHG